MTDDRSEMAAPEAGPGLAGPDGRNFGDGSADPASQGGPVGHQNRVAGSVQVFGSRRSWRRRLAAAWRGPSLTEIRWSKTDPSQRQWWWRARELASYMLYALLAARAIYDVWVSWSRTPAGSPEAVFEVLFIAVLWWMFLPVSALFWLARPAMVVLLVAAAVPALRLGNLHRLGSPGTDIAGLLPSVAVAVLFIWSQRAFARSASWVALRSPFVDGWFAVVEGGCSLTNHHTRAPEQRLALDLVRVRAVAPRLRRFPPRGLGDYISFGATVVSPVVGTVVDAIDGFDDRTGLRWPAGGNCVTIEPDEYPKCRVMLAHLRYGTVTVRPGARVVAGQVLGQLGSSGNSTEPHLHMQANDQHGHALGMVFHGRRRPLHRNDLLRGRRGCRGTDWSSVGVGAVR